MNFGECRSIGVGFGLRWDLGDLPTERRGFLRGEAGASDLGAARLNLWTTLGVVLLLGCSDTELDLESLEDMVEKI